MSGIQRLGAFVRSPHHAWTALLTLGIGLASASVPGMIAAAAAYALGWIFLPDSASFGRWLQRRRDREGDEASSATAERFDQERSKVYAQLSGEGKRDYEALAKVVEEIRAGSGGHGGPHAGRLGQLAWTYLRLLVTRETLTAFCKREQSVEIGQEIAEATLEIADLERQAAEAQESGDAAAAGSLERLLQSKTSRVAGLERHREHVRKAESDLALTHAEIERLFDSVRLIQADLVTRRDPDAMGAEIDRTTAHFHRTRDWLRDLEFDQTSSDVPDDLTAVVPLSLRE